jgi:hypothetical protein
VWWVCAFWFVGSALLNLDLKLMSIEFRKDIPLSIPVCATKMLRPCVYLVVIVLRLSDFSVFGLRHLNVVPCIHQWKVVWCWMLFARRGWGGVVGVRFLVGVSYFLVRDLTSSFFPCEFFNAMVALGLSSVDFRPVTSPLRHLNVVACLIHWKTVGCRLYRGKRRWDSYQRMYFRVGVSYFIGLWARGGQLPSNGCAFRVGVSFFSVRGPIPSFHWECFIVVAILNSSSVDFQQVTSSFWRLNVIACPHRWRFVVCWTWFFQGQRGSGFPSGGCAYG